MPGPGRAAAVTKHLLLEQSIASSMALPEREHIFAFSRGKTSATAREKKTKQESWHHGTRLQRVFRSCEMQWVSGPLSETASIKAVSPVEGGNMMTLVIVTRLKQPGGGSFLKYQIGKLHNDCPEPSNRA